MLYKKCNTVLFVECLSVAVCLCDNSQLKCVKIKIMIKLLQKHCSHVVFNGIYNRETVLVVKYRRPFLFITLAVGVGLIEDIIFKGFLTQDSVMLTYCVVY